MIDGNKIKQTRKKIGLSQSDLAKDITTQGTISSLERNSTSPGSTILVKLLNRLDLKLSDVVINDIATENDQILMQADHFSMNYKYQEVIDSLKDFQQTDDKDQHAHYQFLKQTLKCGSLITLMMQYLVSISYCYFTMTSLTYLPFLQPAN
ncbi:helix-turn-helix domain-containing protein [Companilactobacillus paralimentarius]|uniref:helix-turn-helix domain-containing protein n=1 Tax=Companilactobacillus paralimentarius TaxID=83526 RepID=UPI001265EA7B|nr:helix-turn-helix transcriptional regulator [Companilactobacillus paralimentarius]QFR69394.1 helix-turn-helix domain-containing protein [Companilactobacillus paralimentarius]